MPDDLDLTAVALQRFDSPDRCVSVVNVAERYASDVDEMTACLLKAAELPKNGGRVCELGFGSGWLLEALSAAYPDMRLYGLDLSRQMATHVREKMHGRASLCLGNDVPAGPK